MQVNYLQLIKLQEKQIGRNKHFLQFSYQETSKKTLFL
jgi:hypothetical protein